MSYFDTLQTKLNPLEEALFKAWTRANGIEDPDDPNNLYDYRGVYKQTNGKVHPPGVLTGAAATFNGVQEGQAGVQDMVHGHLQNRIGDFKSEVGTAGKHVQQSFSDGKKADSAVDKERAKAEKSVT